MQPGVVVGIDNGGTSNNTTMLDTSGRFLVDRLVETPSRVLEGPEVAVEALATALDNILAVTGYDRSTVLAVGLDTPGPASADGVISLRGSTNFAQPEWHGFDIRTALEKRIGLQVTYNNDGNSATLYAHHQRFGVLARQRSSVSAIVGTGLGGGIVDAGSVISGAAGMAGEVGHVHIPMRGLLAEDQPVPECNCGFSGDVESVASLTGIMKNLLPYWLTKYPDHQLTGVPLRDAAKQVRGLGEQGDPLALQVFRQQAIAIGRLFTVLANVVDPHAYFVGGGVVEAAPHFREWFLGTIRENTTLRAEQAAVASFDLVPDLDMAGARGSAIAALSRLERAASAAR